MKLISFKNKGELTFIHIIIFLCFSFLITSTLQKEQYELVHELNDTNFETLVNSGQKNPWFLIFYVDTCPHCKKAKEVINKISSNKQNLLREKDENANTKIGLIDCDKNNFNCFRFKISRVPYIIKIDKNYMYEYSEYPSIENFVNFMLQKNNPEEGLEIPKVMGYLDFFTSALKEAATTLNEFIEDYLRSKLNIDIEWKMEYTIVMFLIWICMIIFVEILILSLLCGKNFWKKKDEKVNDVNQKVNENKNEIKENEDKKNK
jgi:glutaredoxin